MPRVWTLVFLTISICAVSQEGALEPKLSDKPLTAEQITVYRAVLRDYLKGSDGALNLADMTEPLDLSDKQCFEGSANDGAKDPTPVIHRFESSMVANTKIVLVDSQQQQSKVKENDPQNLIKRAIDDHQNVTNEQLDQSVKQAFESGLFTFSEIAFDKEHRRAVVAYSLVCGMLCGHGSTLVLRKNGQEWRVTKRCGDWIS